MATDPRAAAVAAQRNNAGVTTTSKDGTKTTYNANGTKTTTQSVTTPASQGYTQYTPVTTNKSTGTGGGIAATGADSRSAGVEAQRNNSGVTTTVKNADGSSTSTTKNADGSTTTVNRGTGGGIAATGADSRSAGVEAQRNNAGVVTTAKDGTQTRYNADGTTTIISGGDTTDDTKPVVKEDEKVEEQKVTTTTPTGSTASTTSTVSTATSNVQALRDLLDQWLTAAKTQSDATIDYGTEQGVNELTRAQEDAQQQYQTQLNQVDIDEAKALDNMALYNEARGDRGGVGAAQYSSIMNNAAQNRLTVSQQQTQLATDTARQIADLRAQGEYEKADAMLELTQNYLGQLMSLEQWALEYQMDVDSFNFQIQKWQAEYNLSLSKLNSTGDGDGYDYYTTSYGSSSTPYGDVGTYNQLKALLMSGATGMPTETRTLLVKNSYEAGKITEAQASALLDIIGA